MGLYSLYLLSKNIRKKPSSNKKSPDPLYHKYTEDKFFEIIWRWRWIGTLTDSLMPLCPKCLYELDYPPDYSGRTAEWYYVSFICDHCKFKHNVNDATRDIFKKVEKQIRRKVRTGEYTQLIKAK